MFSLTIRAPELHEEERRVANLLTRLDFYKEHGYDVSLPEGDLEKVFNERLYRSGVEAVEKDRAIIEEAIGRMESYAGEFSFALPEQVTVVVTKYGVGGSFDVNSGRVVVMMKPDGTLQKPAAHLVVHELLHIATDEAYAKCFKLTHAQNERFIDLLCRDMFGDLLRDYRMQPMGDERMDEVLKGLPDIEMRKRFIEKFGGKRSEPVLGM